MRTGKDSGREWVFSRWVMGTTGDDMGGVLLRLGGWSWDLFASFIPL